MAQVDRNTEWIQDDLRGLVSGEVDFGGVFTQLFASDGSIYEIRPLGVVRPRTAADVAACVQYAAEKQIPIHARGAGSGMAGESLGQGLVLDFSRHLCRVRYIGDDHVRVQPGLVHERLNHQLRAKNRVFGPDPGNSRVTTIGSVIAVDGAGRRWLKYGSPRDHVQSLQVVLADGHAISAGCEPLVDGVSRDADPRKRDLINQLVQLLRPQQEAILAAQPGSRINRCGYRLDGVLGEDRFNLARLLSGSEGTLALITEASLATQPLPRYRGVTLLLFESMDNAARAVMEILPERPTACDLMDRRHVSLARETEVRFDLLLPQQTEAVVVVEIDGDNSIEVRERIHRVIDLVGRQRKLAFDTRQAFDAAEIDLFWQLGRKIAPAVYRSKSAARPVPIVEDFGVPPEMLPEFLVRIQNLLRRHELVAATYSHAGQGQLHVQPFIDLASPADINKIRTFAGELYEEVLSAGGTIAGEHACGLSRTPFVRRQYGPLFDVMREVKRIFDPQNLLNTGKVVGDDPAMMVRDIRPAIEAPEPETAADVSGERRPLKNLIELQLNWNPGQVLDAARACNGCGECRSQARDSRMCPVFRSRPSEEASPRAKVNLIRGVLAGQLPLESLTRDDFKSIADLCFNCHLCSLECPARVDVPKAMAEAKGAYVAANGLRISDALLLRLDLIGKLGNLFSPLANWAMGNRQMRWLLEKLLGVAHARKLPHFASKSFMRRAARKKLTRPTRRTGRKVAYFVDAYANYHDPQLAQALVAVLEHNGVAVYVPPEQKQAGTPAVSCGALDYARRLAQRNVEALAEAVRQGYQVIVSEPAAALTLVREYPNLIDDEDVRLVAESTVEACTYLWKMHTQGRLQLDFHPINATLGYHAPCRLKALRVGTPGENLLRLIPGLSVIRVEEGCSGMAGMYGLKRENYRSSLRIGWGLIARLRDPNLQAGATECSTCKIQMEQGTNKPTLHPIKLLALAYGLMPEVEALLHGPGKELIVT